MSARFDYDTEVVAMPVPALVGVLLLAGAAYLWTPRLVAGAVRPADNRVAGDRKSTTRVFGVIFGVMVIAGVLARLILCASEPMLEDDYQRYLWDGAVTANGHNPYRLSPAVVIESGATGVLGTLAERAGPLLDRIGHPELTTIYPPGTQALFALSYVIEPFSLRAWRAIVLAFDLATLGVLVALLRSVGRDPLWAALYWWNPVVLKQLFNSAHMDGLVLPFVLLALLIAERRPRWATAALGVAITIKFWPIILVPLIWRPAWGTWRTLAGHAVTLLPFVLVSVGPQIATGIDAEAGVVAYASSWSRNSALFPALQAGVAVLLSLAHASNSHAPLIARGIISIAMLAVMAAGIRRTISSHDDRIARATWLVAALVLLSPAQYPWYTVWTAPLLAIHPLAGFMLLPALMPLYELFFYFAARDATAIFTTYIVWMIWVPVWATLLLVDLRTLNSKSAGVSPITHS
jgi:alpha-1,6-mannosyltransferase